MGDRVATGPPGSCSRCYHCLRRDGGMAECMLVKDARQMLYHIPDNLSFEDAVLFDFVATAYRGLIQSTFKMGDNVVLSGAGPIGLAAVQFLRLGGARHITVLEIVEEKRQLAQRFGADLVLDPVAEGAACAQGPHYGTLR